MEELIVVSGYPRSGTSAMMRMLHFGGIKVLADKKRVETPTNDIGNTHGDYELEDLGATLPKLSPEATAGKAVKIVAPYIHYLPLDRPVKVIFMVRDLHEIIASLMAMRVIWEHTPDEAIEYARKFLTHNSILTKYVQFNDFRNFPGSTALGIEEFVGRELDLFAMKEAMDAGARNKKTLLNNSNILQFKAEPLPFTKAPEEEGGNV